MKKEILDFMENQSWSKQTLSIISLTANAFFICITVLTIPSWLEGRLQENSVIVAEKKYNLDDVRVNSPILYSKFQTESANLIKNTLGQFAEEKIFQIASKEKGIQPTEVLREGYVSQEPAETEVLAVFNTYKPQFKGQPLSQVREQIIQSIKNQKEQEYMQRAYQALIVKYPIEFKLKELEPLRIAVEKKNNPSLGKADAKIRVIEFSDFECPYCKRSQDVNKRLREKYKEDIEWVIRDFPLPFHENAMYAHLAANCTIAQGKYWQVVDILFENSGNLSPSNVDYLVSKTGLNKEKYQECIKDKSKLQKEVEEDIEDGQKAGVSGTPAFFINGIFVSGALPFEKFDEMIQKELKK